MRQIATVVQVAIASIMFLLLSVWGVAYLQSQNAERSRSFYSAFSTASGAKTDDYRGHFVIYLDVNACLTCTEDMSIWGELEERLPDCGYTFSIFAPRSDSLDVAYAMELEGLQTPVQVLTENMISDLGWNDKRTPLKALLDINFEAIDILDAPGNREESRQAIDHVLSRACH